MAKKLEKTTKQVDTAPGKRAAAIAASPQPVHVDARIGIGMFFTLTGTILAALGLASRNNPGEHARSLGIDADLWWGLTLLAFGIMMLALGRRGQAKMEKAANKGTRNQGTKQARLTPPA
jgi:hypothetical protein